MAIALKRDRERGTIVVMKRNERNQSMHHVSGGTCFSHLDVADVGDVGLVQSSSGATDRTGQCNCNCNL